MVLSETSSDIDLGLASRYVDTSSETSSDIDLGLASRYVDTSLPKYKIPEKSIGEHAAYQIIHDELMLDGNPRLNLGSFVTTWMEPECDKLIMESIGKNYLDMEEYPVTTEIQKRCVSMIANLFHGPPKAVGVGTAGSSEAIMLACLAFRGKWQERRKAKGKPFDKPNIVAGSNVQVCWRKFANYFQVELKEVGLSQGNYVVDPQRAVDMVDENTICVSTVLGSTLNGEFEDVLTLNSLLEVKNKETLWDTPIHVDAANGGFVAPFIYPDVVWDFQLPLVKSINVSGHKYGLVYPGVGWVIWRSNEELPKDLLTYLASGDSDDSDHPTFSLNFTKSSSPIIGQYYNFIRLGLEGYKKVIEKCRDNAAALRKGLEETGMFNIFQVLSDIRDNYLSVISLLFLHFQPLEPRARGRESQGGAGHFKGDFPSFRSTTLRSDHVSVIYTSFATFATPRVRRGRSTCDEASSVELTWSRHPRLAALIFRVCGGVWVPSSRRRGSFILSAFCCSFPTRV